VVYFHAKPTPTPTPSSDPSGSGASGAGPGGQAAAIGSVLGIMQALKGEGGAPGADPKQQLAAKGRLFKELVLDSPQFRTAVLDILEERAMNSVDRHVDRGVGEHARSDLLRETERLVGTGVVRAGTEYARSQRGLTHRPQPPSREPDLHGIDMHGDVLASPRPVSTEGIELADMGAAKEKPL
jgi:hypothetical protein